MANTEGMSDEALESLLGPNAIPTTAGNNRSSDDRATRRRRALEERMEMSMGDRPAARVIRASPHNFSRQQQQQQQSQQEEEEYEPQSHEGPKPPPIVGKIVERSARPQPQGAPSSSSNNNSNTSQQPKKRQSKFALQRQQQQEKMMQKNSETGANSTGFPSVHVPLGTFVKPKKRVTHNASPTISAARSTAIQPGQSTNHTPTTTTTTTTTSSSTSLASLQKASAHDADNMLAQMTPEERMEKAQELQASLSSDTLAFLKRRAQARNNIPTTTNAPANETVAAHASASKTIPHSSSSSSAAAAAADADSPEEKQRVAELLSNIKSYGDLDVAYQAEMGSYSPLKSSEISSDMAQQAVEDPFPLACTLLRSTVPRQNLWAAQVVSKRLQEQWEAGALCSVVLGANTSSTSPQTPPWPYITMLPASLRCLLDSPVSHTNGYVLHTYVLQALYNLIRLRACAEHVVNVDVHSRQAATASDSIHCNESSMYQEYFLEDAVPTPPLGSCYESIANLEAVDATNTPTTASAAAVAYKTGSSSTSAQRDGEAFAKDPMWTLLTRMCMIPRLAHLLKIAARHDANGERIIPKEAIVAICGILAMIGQRAPGAATAIAHHETLMKNLLDVTVMPRDGSGTEGDSQQPYDPVVALPAMRLLCTVARQSRTSASSIPFDDIVPPLLAMKAQDAGQLELQRWSVILWRTLLRYGFGLPQIPIMVTIATTHMALGNPGMDPYSLTAELSSSFANVLQCVQISRRCIAKKESGNKEDVISKEQYDALSQADLWLSSSAQQVITQLENTLSESVTAVEVPPTEVLRFRSGQLQFLSAFLRTSNEDVRLSVVHERGESKTVDPSASNTWIRSCQQVLVTLVKDGLLKQALDLGFPDVFAVDFNDLSSDRVAKDAMIQEASACSFLCSFVSLQHFLLMESRKLRNDISEAQESESQESLAFVVGQFASIVTENILRNMNPSAITPEGLGDLSTTARRGWLNRAGFAIVELLTAAKDVGILPLSGGSAIAGLLRKLQFALLGRLERGDEAMAAILFSQDSSFKASDPADSVEDSSILSSMFFREMCRTGSARSRLDHSFKLKHGPGISHDEFGCFKLSTLLSDADSPGQAGDSPDFALPVGKLWLWQVLSSTTALQSKENVTPEANEREREVVEILSSCLSLILELEETDTADALYTYSSLIPAGAKAYHLLMLCLQPETIMQNSRVTAPAGLLLDNYISNRQQKTLFGVDFARACVVHTGIGKKKSTTTPKDDEEAKTGKLLSLMVGKPSVDSAGQFDERELRALVQFSGELCEAYIEYGAQYDFFTKCIRIFLLPSFPAKVRSQTMRRLGDILHLISLPGEDDPSSEECKQRLASLLEGSIAGDLASARDPPEFLDAVASVYAKGASPRIVFGYVFLLGVLVQSRHLAICYQPGSMGLEAAKRRLQTVNAEFVSVVIDATKRFLTSSGKSSTRLVCATMEAALSWNKVKPVPQQVDVSESIDRLKDLVA